MVNTPTNDAELPDAEPDNLEDPELGDPTPDEEDDFTSAEVPFESPADVEVDDATLEGAKDDEDLGEEGEEG